MYDIGREPTSEEYANCKLALSNPILDPFFRKVKIWVNQQESDAINREQDYSHEALIRRDVARRIQDELNRVVALRDNIEQVA
jgi:hypothetical protein